MNHCTCTAEADLLCKYKEIFPEEFVDCVRKGVSWLCTHNNITYQTSIMVASDRVLFNTAGSSILRVGLINTDLPLTGLTFYEVKAIEVAKDEISGSTIFNVKMKYTTPMGLNITLVPITYFDPEVAPEVYTKYEIDAMIEKLQALVDTKADAQVANDLIDGIYNQLENNESVVKLEAKVDDMLQSLALDYVTKEELDEKLDGLAVGGNVDLTTYLKIKDAEDTYATKESVTDLDTKVQAIDLDVKADKTDLDALATKDEVKAVDDKLADYTTTTDLQATYATAQKVTEVEGKVDAIDLQDYAKTAEVTANIATAKTEVKDEVVDALKADDAFKASLKGEKGDTGAEGPQGIQGLQGTQGPKGDKGDNGINGTSPSAAEVATAVKTDVVNTLKADQDFINSLKGSSSGDTTTPQQPSADAPAQPVVKSVSTDQPVKTGQTVDFVVESDPDTELEVTILDNDNNEKGVVNVQ